MQRDWTERKRDHMAVHTVIRLSRNPARLNVTLEYIQVSCLCVHLNSAFKGDNYLFRTRDILCDIIHSSSYQTSVTVSTLDSLYNNEMPCYIRKV